METSQKNGFEYFWDANIRLWTVYPIDSKGKRVEWDELGKPIEAEYFPNRKLLDKFLNSK
jgi:hypothetical protein